jgi:hypothetical protein
VNKANIQLGELTRQFSKDIISSSWQVRATKRLAQFDNTTTRMQDRLTNLSARGQDVSTAQNILVQITALRPQLQTALENHDETALKSVNSQLLSLDHQFSQALRELLSGLRSQQTNRTPENRGMNRSFEDRGINRTAGNRGMNQTAPNRFL